jgi:hypothetical protein
VGTDGVYELREPDVSYNDISFVGENSGLKSENTYFWAYLFNFQQLYLVRPRRTAYEGSKGRALFMRKEVIGIPRSIQKG